MPTLSELLTLRDSSELGRQLLMNEALMTRWSREDALAYFASGGLFAPASWEPNGYRAPKSEW